MAELARPNTGLKRDWVLGQSAFQGLLDWLDEGTDSGGEKYVETRRRLVCYFDRKRCLSPDELADETLNRVARRIEEEGAITDTPPARYCYIVAKFVFLEYLRRAEHKQVSFDELSGPGHPTSVLASLPEPDDTQTQKERLLDCLQSCLVALQSEDRELILQYYSGERRAKIENRRLLAARLTVTVNALSIRACRIRDKLEACVGRCCTEA